MMVVLPAPVGPTIATFVPGATLTEKSRMIGVFPSYEKHTLLNSTSPFTVGIVRAGSASGSSYVSNKNSKILSLAASKD